MRLSAQERKVVYAFCMGLCALILLLTGVLGLPNGRGTAYTSRHPASTMAPLMGFAADALVNLGDAGALDELPGVGEVISRRMVETREMLGGFRLPEDLLLVKGIGEKTLAQILDGLPEELVALPELLQ